MGQVIDFAARRDARHRRADLARPGRAPATFFFDVVSPLTYLAAERVDRLFPGADWCPVDPLALGPAPSASALSDLREHATVRAAELNMPLVWPESPLAFGPAGCFARRAAAFAASRGRGASFALAAGRLAFCGGFELDDPDAISEAAVAARLSARECLEAAVDPAWDAASADAARFLAALGPVDLPAVSVEGRLFAGEHRLAEAAAAASALAG